jgi:SAF domain
LTLNGFNHDAPQTQRKKIPIFGLPNTVGERMVDNDDNVTVGGNSETVSPNTAPDAAGRPIGVPMNMSTKPVAAPRDRSQSAKPKPTKRRPWFIGSGVLLSIFAAVIGGLVLGAKGQQRALVATTRIIPAGTKLTRDMLRIERVDADVQLAGINSKDLGALVGRITNAPIAANSLVLMEAVGTTTSPPPGFALLSLLIEPGEAPTSLQYGDRLHIILSPQAGPTIDRPTGVIAVASVWSISTKAQMQPGELGRRLINIMVRSSEEVAVAQGAARHEIRLALVEGGPIWVHPPADANPPTATQPVTQPAAVTPPATKPKPAP